MTAPSRARRIPGDETNAVLDQQHRLLAELGAERHGLLPPPASEDPYAALLSDVLASAGWQGDQHRIFEALPHLEGINSVTGLRTVLARLGVRLVLVDRKAADLTPNDYPCLVVGAGPNTHIRLLRKGADAKTYDMPAQMKTSPGEGQGGGACVYLIRAAQTEETQGTKPGSFVGQMLRRTRRSMSRIMGYSAAINIVSLVLSLYVLLIYDVVIATGSMDTLIGLAIGGAAVLILEMKLRRARSEAIAYLAARFDGSVVTHTLASVLNMPLSLTERAPIASQLTRFRQFEIGRELFAGPLASALFDLPFTLIFLAALFVIGGTLAFVPVALSVVVMLVCALAMPAGDAQIGRLGTAKLKSDALLLELNDKLRAIRNSSAESVWLGRYAESLAAYQRARFGNLQLVLCLQTVTGGLVGIAGILTLGIGALRIMEGLMSAGQLVAAMIIVWRVLVPIQIVALNLSRLRQTLATARQIDDVSRMSGERRQEQTSLLSRRLKGDLFTAGAYLSLGGQSEPQLRGVNLKVKAGEIVAITGPSGSGKSTLLKLLMGLYPNYMGTVHLDGFDLRQLGPAELRAAIGYAAQQPAIFYGSIAANMRLANPGASDGDIVDALAAVGITLPNAALPDGLETRISGSGARALPQGLLYRLSIARALVKAAPILLFDDMGNGLDHAGDAAFLSHLGTLRDKHTVLMVTARPSHMRAADRVIEMRGGIIIAEGSPEAMLPRIIPGRTDAA
jgi:ATP-binding cassette, subfamily C, bacterial LapB